MARSALLLAVAATVAVVAGCGSSDKSGSRGNAPQPTASAASGTGAPSAAGEGAGSSFGTGSSFGDGSTYDSGGSSYGGSGDDSDYSPYADAQDAWDNEDGPDWETFTDGYVAGWDEGCDTAFEDSPDGYLYDQGEQFSTDDCQANNPQDPSDASDIPYDVPDDPYGAGEDLGQADGCESAFADLPSDGGGELFYGDEYYDDSTCPTA